MKVNEMKRKGPNDEAGIPEREGGKLSDQETETQLECHPIISSFQIAPEKKAAFGPHYV